MASLNKVMLIGNLGQDPEIRYTTSGQAVASFNIATSERIKGKSGEYEERTEWHKITLWGKLAEIAGEYLAKGRTIYVEGRLQTRKWQDKDGNDRYTTEIVGERMQMLGGKDAAGASAGQGKQQNAGGNKQGQSQEQGQRAGQGQSGRSQSRNDDNYGSFTDDDIPF